MAGFRTLALLLMFGLFALSNGAYAFAYIRTFTSFRPALIRR